MNKKLRSALIIILVTTMSLPVFSTPAKAVSPNYPMYWEEERQIMNYKMYNDVIGNYQQGDWGGVTIGAQIFDCPPPGDPNVRNDPQHPYVGFASLRIRLDVDGVVNTALRDTDQKYFIKYIKLAFDRMLDSGYEFQSVSIADVSAYNLKSQDQIPNTRIREDAELCTYTASILCIMLPGVGLALDTAMMIGSLFDSQVPDSHPYSWQNYPEEAVVYWINPSLDHWNNPEIFGNICDQSIKEASAYCDVLWNTYDGTPAPWMLQVNATVGIESWSQSGSTEGVHEVTTCLMLQIQHDTTPPAISTPGYVSYPQGSTAPQSITWQVSDTNPKSYSIEKQTIRTGAREIVSSGEWNDIEYSLTQDVSGLQAGTYIYTCTVSDRLQHISSDPVTVIVTTPGYDPPLMESSVSPQLQTRLALADCASALLSVKNNYLPNPSCDDYGRYWDIYVSTDLPIADGVLYFVAGSESYGVCSHEESNHQWQPSAGYTAKARAYLVTGGQIQYNMMVAYSLAVEGQIYNINIKIVTGYEGLYGLMNPTDTYYESIQVKAVPPPDTTPPTIDQPADVTYPYPTPEYSITWHPRDAQPVSKQITIDGTPQQSQSWDGGDVTVQVGGLALGEHTFTCTVTDAGDNPMSDTVKVIVVAPDPTPQTVYKLATGEPTRPYGESIQRGTVADTHVSDNLYEVVRCGSDGFFPYAMQCYYSFQFTEAPRSCVTNLAFSVEAKTDLYPNEWYLTVFVSLYNSATGSWNDIGSLTNIDTIIGGNLDINSYMDSSGDMRIYFWGYAFFAPFTVSVDNIYFAVTYVMS